ncbi:MAG TPA: aminoglycoside phosphotransferase family protein [Candidatus Eisenbacteria bacterium]|nr:aminoglycoside phosphotransferase family protein [Candidatus Eisenbacteria bacterium]
MTTKSFNFSENSLKHFSSIRKKVFYPKADILFLEQELIKEKEKIFASIPLYINTIFRDSCNETVMQYSLISTKSTYHVLYKVVTKKHTYVLRVSALQSLYTDFTFFTEEKIQNALKQLHMPSVKIFLVDVSRKYYPFDFMIMEFIEGDTLEDKRYSALNDVYTNLGRVLKKIHSIPLKGVGLLSMTALLKKGEFSGISSNWEEFFYTNLSKHISKTYSLKVITKKSKQIIERIFSENSMNLNERPMVLIHNDLATRNVIFHKTKIKAILDWEDTIIGDLLWEVAFVNTFLFEKKQQKYFQSFCNGLGMDSSVLQSSYLFWFYFLRIMLVKVATRSVSGYYNAKGIENDRQRFVTALRMIEKLHE